MTNETAIPETSRSDASRRARRLKMQAVDKWLAAFDAGDFEAMRKQNLVIATADELIEKEERPMGLEPTTSALGTLHSAD